ncbi:MAG: ImmA/IrrE family metallo-endopeptidase [Actinomycetota bacterium]
MSFVGSLDLTTNSVEAAATMSEALGFQVEARGARWADAFRKLTEQAEELGVLVMVNGVVGSNTHRKLNPQEFRGFAMVDDIAPLIFVNGADTKAAQIFSLAHELAHIWLGQSALSDVEVSSTSGNATERWCNEVAAEVLVPLHSLRDAFSADRPLTDELDRLAREFKVSTLVVLRRIRDAGHLTVEQYRSAYTAELDRVLGILAEGISSGGNFYNTQPVRVSRRFARAVISNTLEGQTLYRDALQMLGIKKLSTFQELSHRLGIA